MGFLKFADITSNTNDNLLGDKSDVGIKSGSQCKSSEVNGAIRQNSIVAYALLKALDIVGSDQINFNESYTNINTNNPIGNALNTFIGNSEATIKNYNNSTGSIKSKFVEIEGKLSELGFKNASFSTTDKGRDYIASPKGYNLGKVEAIEFGTKRPTSESAGNSYELCTITNIPKPTSIITLGSTVKSYSRATIKATYYWTTDNKITVTLTSVDTSELGTVNNNKLICVINYKNSEHPTIYTTN